MTATTPERVFAFLTRRGWLAVEDPECISRLSAGEHNENWLVEADGDRFVFRFCHGSPLRIHGQAAYEFAVLHALAPSGVTPRPFYCETDAEGFSGGVLLMEHLEGRPLEYGRDEELAAHVYATLHRRPGPEDLMAQSEPLRAMADESLGLVTEFSDHPLQAQAARLLRCRDEVLRLAETADPLLAAEAQVLANTEASPGDFIVNDAAQRAWLVDWEKAVVTSRWQDVGRFLAPTTTRWATGHSYDRAGRRAFLARYLELADDGMPLDEAEMRAGWLMRAVILRDLSWCHRAAYAPRRLAGERASDRATIQAYMGGLDWFLSQQD